MHVALIDAEGTPEIHEELPAEKAPERAHMLKLQVELNTEIEGKPGYRAYMGEDWPPAGYRLYRGKLKRIEVPPDPAPEPEEPPA